MSQKQAQLDKADKIGPYQHIKLDSPDEIRLLHLLPGKFDDEIRFRITHVLLKQPKEQQSTRLSRSELQKTVPSGWEVFETPECRYLFCYDPEDDAGAENSSDGLTNDDDGDDDDKFQTTWVHPDPKMDPALYVLEPDSEIWAREPAFDCLSYVWGSQEDSEPGFVESDTGDRIGAFKLGPNLASALHHLRYEDKPRTLWVDVICINQKDPDEKAVAVKCLSKMYSLTTRVVVWLGPEEDGSSVAISLLAHVGAQIETTLDGFRLTSPDAEEPTWYDIDVNLPISPSEWEAIEELVSRPWFTRVWTVQEIVLANRLTILHAGSAVISWALFRRAVECILDKKTVSKARVSLGKARTAIMNGNERPLAQLLMRHGSRSCLDPHDKVYGILALTPPKFLATIVPNYEQPVAETYKNAFLININTIRRWELFGSTPDERTIEAPSWVPDIFPEYPYGFTSAHQLVSGCSELQFRYKEPNKLEIKGIRFDTIEFVGGWAPPSGLGALRMIRSWEPEDLFTAQYHAGGSLFDAYVITLFQYCIRERHPIEEGWPTLEELKRYFRNKVFSTATQPKKVLDLGDYLDSILYGRCLGRSLFKTAGGSIGLGPPTCLPGDVVCVILGCDRPLILRPNPDGTYQFLSHAFVYDLQDSQALLGPLPSPWRVQVYEHPQQEFRNYNQYFNHETKKLTPEDPRLGPLSDWERIPLDRLGRDLTGDDPEVMDFFKNLKDGRIVNSDPRLSPDALEKMGVKLEAFVLT
ncbi:heterokaryon incompatibility protein-domain-containing protein [Dactylonectria estremocensis]|uniref:Heterokaryon incompatibility protein-domain-containing protein n=1 Tax=Dactylonectria estremocensis TaxID=1079267 RepID=A0A9P9J8D6_9HYPO|nr:heterokaryon incompatibility protein-domain-containing protein [Dactylonectria estremocensis]